MELPAAHLRLLPSVLCLSSAWQVVEKRSERVDFRPRSRRVRGVRRAPQAEKRLAQSFFNSLLERHAAAYFNNGPVDVARLVGSEECERIGDFLGLAEPAERHPHLERANHLFR